MPRTTLLLPLAMLACIPLVPAQEPVGPKAPAGDKPLAATEPPRDSLSPEEAGSPDPAFDRFVTASEVAEAVAALNADALVDAVVGLAEAERLYQRKHRGGLTADRLLTAAGRVAVETDDRAALDRLRRIAADRKNEAWLRQLDAAKEWQSWRFTPGTLDPAAADEVREFHANFGRLCLAAELSEDTDLLGTLKEAVGLQPGLPEVERKAMVAAADRALARAVALKPKADPSLKTRDIASEKLFERAVGGVLEGVLLDAIGDTKVEFSDSWGHRAKVWRGKTKVVFQGFKSRVEKIHEEVDDGLWSRGWVRLENAEDTLDVKFRNFKPTKGKLEVKFDLVASCRFRGKIEARQYKAGVKLWSATAEGRATGTLSCSVRVYIFDNGKRLGWEVNNVDLKYSDVVMDKVGALGGETARLLGDAFTGAIDKWFADEKEAVIKDARKTISDTFSDSRDLRNEIGRLIRSLPH